MDKCFSVALSCESVAVRKQRLAQRLVVVDFAVEHHPGGTVFIGNRLMTGAQINDAQPAHADPADAVDVDAVVVRSAVANLRAHGANGSRFGPAFAENKTSYSAHLVLKLSQPTGLERYCQSRFEVVRRCNGECRSVRLWGDCDGGIRDKTDRHGQDRRQTGPATYGQAGGRLFCAKGEGVLAVEFSGRRCEMQVNAGFGFRKMPELLYVMLAGGSIHTVHNKDPMRLYKAHHPAMNEFRVASLANDLVLGVV